MAFKTFYGEPPIIDDYFYGVPKHEEDKEEIFLDLDGEKQHHGLMLEWGVHYCHLHPDFTTKFKRFYNMADAKLFTNSHLNFNIYDDLKAQQSIKSFV